MPPGGQHQGRAFHDQIVRVILDKELLLGIYHLVLVYIY